MDDPLRRPTLGSAFFHKDPEGHVWSFGQSVRLVKREVAEKASDLEIEGWV